MLWISPNKPLEARLQNNCLSLGLTKLLAIFRLIPDSDQVEVDWNQGVVWVADKRMMALSERGLLCEASDRTLQVRLHLDTRDRSMDRHCYFNLTIMHQVTRTALPELEVALVSE